MKTLILLLIFSCVICSAQTTRFTKLSKTFDVKVDRGTCGDDGKCGPLKIALYRKHSRKPFQKITAGRIFKSDAEDPISFTDVNFDGKPDLLVSDGFTAPAGYGTFPMRIYLYSVSRRRFVYHPALSQLSRLENMGPVGIEMDKDKKRRVIFTYSRPGGGVFCHRGYSVTGDKVQMVEETVTDTTPNNGALTLITTRKLINGRWREWRKHAKLPINN